MSLTINKLFNYDDRKIIEDEAVYTNVSFDEVDIGGFKKGEKVDELYQDTEGHLHAKKNGSIFFLGKLDGNSYEDASGDNERETEHKSTMKYIDNMFSKKAYKKVSSPKMNYTGNSYGTMNYSDCGCSNTTCKINKK